MATRNGLKQRLKMAAKRRERRQANRPDDVPTAPAQNSFEGPRPLDVILESMTQWSLRHSAATDSDVAAAVRECLTGHKALSAYSQDLVRHWRDLNQSASWEPALFRSALGELNKIAQQYRHTADPRAMIGYIAVVVA